MKVMHVVGARPNFMKVAPIMREMAKYSQDFEQLLIHTGQHYDDNMSKVFFEELELPRPDINLEVGSGSHAWQTAQVMLRLEPVLLDYKPDLVLVVGDVNSTLAGALTAAKLGTRVGHVEAGLRSFDRSMPEEYNRLLTDHIADLLFTPSRNANENLQREGIPDDRIHFVGNVMIDTLVRLLPKALERWHIVRSTLNVPADQRYVLVTLHRPSNVDEPETLREILAALTEIAHELPVIFPIHPRTSQRIVKLGLDSQFTTQRGNSRFHLTAPLGYLDFLAFMKQAALVLTDSGGIQEETTFLGVPCLTVRPNTERPITITQGTNRLVPNERGALVEAVRSMLNNDRRLPTADCCPELWDGHAAKRIVDVIRRT
jgi:UDP-N-acetylglucosamine 2-epimerase (non-hydrolysing)